MFLTKRPAAQRGSWLWALGVAELTAWGTTVTIFLVVQLVGLEGGAYMRGLLLSAALVAWYLLLFKLLLPRAAASRSPVLFRVGIAGNLLIACITYAFLRGYVPAAQLVFVPTIVGTGLLTTVPETLAGGLAAVAGYWIAAQLTGGPPSAAAAIFNSGIFLLSATVAGLLSRELRSHFRGEQEEHQIAEAVRHRLLAVLDAVDEGVVFSDPQGTVRALNRRADDLFGLEEAEHVGRPVVQLLRTVARRVEDPEGFMEAFQEARHDPEFELRLDVEQVLPARRRLRLKSAPAYDESGLLVGRIDVYTDVTESARRAEEIEQLYQQARKTAESYQRALLPDSPPRLPRINMVAHYVAAAGRRAVCGDFYDFVPLADGRMMLVLGDVVGAGPVAANDAALTRYTLRSHASEVTSPAELLRWLNGRLDVHLSAERYVRLLLCVVDPERAQLEYVSAGHVPPLVYRAASREIEWLEAGDVALGIVEDAEYKAARVQLEAGDLLVCYTDGITEAPRLGQPFGQGHLSDIVQLYGRGTPGELAQALRRAVDAWVSPEDLRDDLALVISQVAPDSALGEPSRELVLPNEPARTREIRNFVGALLADVRAPVEVSTEILLAVGEAAANAIKYGRRTEGRSEVRVRCSVEDGRLTAVIADDGPGFEVTDRSDEGIPDPFASGGRGLFLMRELMDEARIESTPQGTTVTLVRRLDGPARASLE